MATSRGFDAFARRWDRISRRIEQNVAQGMRKAVLVGDAVAVNETPVRTGRARSNWIASPGAPIFQDNPYSGAPESAADLALSQAIRAVGGWNGAGSFFLSNGTEYIDELDQGSSRQAPEGMSAAALAAIRGQIKLVKALEGIESV